MARNEHRLRIAHTERLQPAQGLKKLRRNLIEGKLRIDGDGGLEVFQSQMLASISIEMRAKIFHLRCRQRKTHRMRMAAVAAKQIRTGFERIQQVKGGNGAARAVCLISV